MHVLRGYWAAAISEAGISVEHRMQYEHLRMVCLHLPVTELLAGMFHISHKAPGEDPDGPICK